MTKSKFILKEIGIWLVINLLLSLSIPMIFLYFSQVFVGSEKSFGELFIELFKNGFHIFVGTILILSVFQDYDAASRLVKPLAYGVIFVSMTFNGLLFMSDNNIIPIPFAFSFEENLPLYFLNLFSCILISTYLKYKIANYLFDIKDL